MKLRSFTVLIFAATFLFPSLISVAKEPKRPDSYAYTRGVEAVEADNLEEAEEWMLRELKDNPNNGYAYLYMSAIYHSKEKMGEALNAAEKAIKMVPKKDKEWSAATYLCRANLNLEMGDTVKGLVDYGRALNIDPNRQNALRQRGDVYFELGEYALSDADFRKLTEVDPGGALGYMGLGRNALRQDKLDEALKQFNKAVVLDPEYDSGYSFRAETYLKMKKWNEAADDLIKALNLTGDTKAFYLMLDFPKEGVREMKAKLKVMMAKEPAESAWPFYYAALIERQKDYKEAVGYYEKAFSIDGSPVLLYYAANCAESGKLHHKALDLIERAISLNPNDADYLKARGGILDSLGRYEEAMQDWDKYVELNPAEPLAYALRGEGNMRLRRFDEAAEDFTMAGAVLPAFLEDDYGLMKRGDAYLLAGKKAEAEADYRKMIATAPDTLSVSRPCLPFAYSGLGDREKALETMQYIVDNDTTDRVGNLYNLACQYARLGMNEEAVKELRNCIEEGYKDVVHIEVDYDLDPLREMLEFKALVDELKKRNAAEDDDAFAGAVTEDIGREETVEIPFTKEYGVTKVKCEINELPLYFVFDTGASDVTLSMVEANFMLKNEYIKPTDVVGTSRYIDANGDVSEGTTINLRKVNFGGLELDNVRASVVRNQKAPLLLGQSVLGRLGKIEIDNNNQKLKITHRVK